MSMGAGSKSKLFHKCLAEISGISGRATNILFFTTNRREIQAAADVQNHPASLGRAKQQPEDTPLLNRILPEPAASTHGFA
jgi:hypothetical protein